MSETNEVENGVQKESTQESKFMDKARKSRGGSILMLGCLVVFLAIGTCCVLIYFLSNIGQRDTQDAPSTEVVHRFDFEAPMTLGVYTETETEGARPYWVPDERNQVSWSDPMPVLAFVPISPTRSQLQNVGHLPPNTWCTILGELEGGLLPVEIDLVVPQRALTEDPSETEIRFHEVTNRPTQKEIFAFQEWLENGLISVERGELLKNPEYRYGEAANVVNYTSFEIDYTWQRVSVMVWINAGMVMRPGERFNRAPDFVYAEYQEVVEPGQTITIKAIFVDNEGHDFRLDWDGCEPLDKYTCEFSTGGITNTTELSVTVQAIDELGARSEIERLSITIEGPQPTPTPPPCEGSVYTIKPGEWLAMIGRRYGLKWEEIVRETNLRVGMQGIIEIRNPSLVHGGQKIWLPGVCVEE